MKKTFIENAQQFEINLLDSLQMIDLEKLQADGIYLVPTDENEMTQNEIETLFNTSDWSNGVTAYISQIVDYLNITLTPDQSEYVYYLENK